MSASSNLCANKQLVRRDLDEFHSTLEEALEKADKRGYTIVQGDWNCQIGSDAYEDWKGTVGKYELKRTGKGEGEKEHRDLLNDTS